MPNEALFRSFLNTERIGREIFCPETTSSTMDFLKQRADDLSDGAAVICGEQTSGRGRRGRKWTSGKNQSLALSFLLKTPRTRQISAVTLVCGLACANALNRLFGSGFGVKWPNDPIFSEKKIGGILCESILSGDSCSIVCGIGINLTQDAQFFIDAGLPHAASILS
ncbi:MAG TPA: biotin--[acetyl-CoA-carboxylase] ligase, partial [Clostridia bacterium]|nr:biotin--[acetyl-CoA-carboxylase] ligase [Clostridia bacterium]